MNIIFNVQDADVKAALRRLAEKVGNLRPAMTEIGARYERSVLENFAAEKSPDGTPWQPLSATTLLLGLKKKKGFKKSGFLSAKGKNFLQNKKILVQSQTLKNRVHYQAGNNSVSIGTAGVRYAGIHQFGGMAGRNRQVKIPARPWLAVNQGNTLELSVKDKAMVLEVINRHIAAAV